VSVNKKEEPCYGGGDGDGRCCVGRGVRDECQSIKRRSRAMVEAVATGGVGME
jgi:hypothetical protein